MRTWLNNPLLQYTFIVCLGLALTIGQAFKLHLHVKSHTDNAASNATQIGQLHIASTLHKKQNDSDSHSLIHKHEHSTEIDISSDSLVKKAIVLVLAILLFLVSILLLCSHSACRIRKYFSYVTKRPTTLRYLVNPPLRAPPASSHI
jgi:hypothetical protein